MQYPGFLSFDNKKKNFPRISPPGFLEWSNYFSNPKLILKHCFSRSYLLSCLVYLFLSLTLNFALENVKGIWVYLGWLIDRSLTYVPSSHTTTCGPAPLHKGLLSWMSLTEFHGNINGARWWLRVFPDQHSKSLSQDWSISRIMSGL